MTSVLVGCATHPVTLAAVGPNPNGLTSGAATGQLEVLSQLQGESEGDNPPWYQHSDYFIYNERGNSEVERVDNSIGRYGEAPRIVNLPAGKYVVKALASNYRWVKVPVAVEPGRTTRVHLDSNWNAPGGTPITEIVSIPGGYPVGWSTSATDRMDGH
jgi:hypothetical protein